jgi:hypothetical protein
VNDLAHALDNDVLSFLPLWGRQLVVLVVFAVVGFLFLRWFVRHGLPRLAAASAGPLAGAVGALGLVFLLPEFGVTRLLTHRGKPVPGVVYAYGDNVARLTAGTQGLLRKALRKLGILRRTPAIVVLVLLAALFARWDTSQCAGTAKGMCVSPVTQWRHELATWRTAQKA